MTQVDLLTFSMRSEPPKADADWFRIVSAKAGGPAKVYIYDEIGFWGTSAKDFAAQLNEIDSKEIELHLNSPGGSVFDGLAIMAALKNHSAKIVGIVDGIAASAASFILQAADERLSTRNAQIMIHDAKAYAGGNAEQMRKAADLLDRTSDNIADIYAVRSGQGDVKSWRDIMRAGDEWYSGNEALEAGLIDSVIDNPEEDDEEDASAKFVTNTWTTEEVEAFIKTPNQQLAASSRLTINNRVEEAHMTGENPKNAAPPVVPQPTAASGTVASTSSNAIAAPAQAPAAAAAVFMVNGLEVTDFSKVQAHITSLESFKKETITSGRKSFVAQLATDGKIAASDDSLTATEEFALSLTPEQFTAWKGTMESAPVSTLFQKHGTEVGDKNAPENSNAGELKDRVAVLEGVVASHEAMGLSKEQIEAKDSFKELQTLKSQLAAD